MSGFFGIVRTDGAAVEKPWLERVAKSLEFRGPDGNEVWAKGRVGFCFSFLDVKNRYQLRKQPAQLSERFWLIGDVRLDARRELVAALRDNDQPATEQTPDEGLLLFAWNFWGEACLPRILGDFSFGLWDSEEQSLVCARDFVGARPFFYACSSGVFCFTNTLQVMRLVPEISAELDDVFVRDFLLDGRSGDLRRTVWRDTRRLPAGHRLRFSNGKIEIKRFLQLPIEDPLHLKRSDEYLENFRELLQLAVADRTPEGKTSLYLSGGLDSASVCATAMRNAALQGGVQDLKAFTVSWRPVMDDPEPQFAKLTARHLGLPHEILGEERAHPYESMELHGTPEPTADVFLDRACRHYNAINAHSRVVLSGDGGDDILTGAAWPYLLYLRSRGDWRGIVRDFGGYFLTHGQIPPLLGGFRARLRRPLRRKDPERKIPQWLNDEFLHRIPTQSPQMHRAKEFLSVHPVHPRAYRSLHSGYWSMVLEEEDAGYTGVNLETRAPFLDLRLLRFFFRLPPVPWCANKELTRRAMESLLPAAILKRAKTPLVRDSLAACLEWSDWTPVVPKNLPKRIHEFVEWGSWLATLKSPPGCFTWENSYPLSLCLWLKAIENT